MKIIDYAIIFVIILMPIVLAVSIDINSQIKAQNVEVYYKNLIDSAISDASQEMKELENDDIEIDYGYDKEENKKVSINAEHAVNTFLDSLYFNLGINGNKQAESLLLNYIPVALVIDYNGLHTYSMETMEYQNKDGQMQKITEHVLKPKKYYSYSYDLKKYCMEEGKEDIYTCKASEIGVKIVPGNTYNVIFTLSDYITLIEKDASGDYTTYSRYAKDMLNKLFPSVSIFDLGYSPGTLEIEERQNELLVRLNDIKKDLIINMVTDELSYAVSKHNSFAKNLGVEYSFQFSKDVAQDWYSTVQDVGVISFVQGIALGNNQYLNHYAFGGGQLNYTQKYLVTRGTTALSGYDKLYHKTENCEIYKSDQAKKDLKPLYYGSKYKAATAGFYPCPVCITLSSSIDINKYEVPKILIDGPYLASDINNINRLSTVTAGESIKFVVTYEKGSEDQTASLTRDKVVLNNFDGGARIEEAGQDILGNPKYNLYIDGIIKFELVNGAYIEIGGTNSLKSITIKGNSVTDKLGKNAENSDSSQFRISDIKGDPRMIITGPNKTDIVNGDTLEYKVKFVKGYNDISVINLVNSKVITEGFNANISIRKDGTYDYTITLSNISNTNIGMLSKYITINGDAIRDIEGGISSSIRSGSFKIKNDPPIIEIYGPSQSSVRIGGSISFEVEYKKTTHNIKNIDLNVSSIILNGFTANIKIEKISDIRYKIILENVQGGIGPGKYITIKGYTVIDEKGNQPYDKSSNSFTLNPKLPTIYNFGYTGQQQSVYLEPGKYKFEVWGARGANGSGPYGEGGYSSGEIQITGGTWVYIYTGQTDIFGGQAFNGGGGSYHNYSPSGGGATDIRLAGGSWNNINSLRSRIIIAGGGGSGEWSQFKGGLGGGLVGGSGLDRNSRIVAGGNQTSGGTASGIKGEFGWGGWLSSLNYDCAGGGRWWLLWWRNRILCW